METAFETRTCLYDKVLILKNLMFSSTLVGLISTGKQRRKEILTFFIWGVEIRNYTDNQQVTLRKGRVIRFALVFITKMEF